MPLNCSLPPRFLGLRLCLLPALLAFLVVGASGAAESSVKKPFDIPAGDAVASLKRFSAQSGTQVIFPEDAIEGAKTKAVKGTFTPAEAIDRLLSGTSLTAAQDRESGAFAVTRDPVPRKGTGDPNG